jgi:hypothetical protein
VRGVGVDLAINTTGGLVYATVAEIHSETPRAYSAASYSSVRFGTVQAQAPICVSRIQTERLPALYPSEIIAAIRMRTARNARRVARSRR